MIARKIESFDSRVSSLEPGAGFAGELENHLTHKKTCKTSNETGEMRDKAVEVREITQRHSMIRSENFEAANLCTVSERVPIINLINKL